jgi:hypothetical protein
MATETLNPNAEGDENGYTLSEGSGDKFALINDGDDGTYLHYNTNAPSIQLWKINIDGSEKTDGSAPGASVDDTITAFTREINSTNFSGCPTITKALITSLEIGIYSGTSSFINSQTFNLDDPTFPDSATINSVTINGRLSYTSAQTRLHEISLVVDYTEDSDLSFLKILSGNINIQSGQLIIK